MQKSYISIVMISKKQHTTNEDFVCVKIISLKK
jgi:hypothetical protein